MDRLAEGNKRCQAGRQAPPDRGHENTEEAMHSHFEQSIPVLQKHISRQGCLKIITLDLNIPCQVVGCRGYRKRDAFPS